MAQSKIEFWCCDLIFSSTTICRVCACFQAKRKYRIVSIGVLLKPQHCTWNFQGCYQYLLNLTNNTATKLIITHRHPHLSVKSQVLHCILDLFQKVKINSYSSKNEQDDPPLAETIISNVQSIERNSSFSECFLTVCNRQLATLSSRAIITPSSRAVTTNIGIEQRFQWFGMKSEFPLPCNQHSINSISSHKISKKLNFRLKLSLSETQFLVFLSLYHQVVVG